MGTRYLIQKFFEEEYTNTVTLTGIAINLSSGMK
jgi:hypothetical protein